MSVEKFSSAVESVRDYIALVSLRLKTIICRNLTYVTIIIKTVELT